MKDQISIKRVEAIHPKVVNIFKAFIDEAESKLNTTFRVVQGFRTFAEQQALYDQPWDKKDNDGDGKIDESDERVTKAKPGQSYHNYGLAVDLVELKDGKVNWNFDYSKLEAIAKKYGIKWGFRVWGWDKPHFHYDFNLRERDLYAKYLKKQFIPGTQFLNL